MSDIEKKDDQLNEVKGEEGIKTSTTPTTEEAKARDSDKKNGDDDIEDVNINDDGDEKKDSSPIQLVDPEPAVITEEDMQMKPIEINDDEIDDELEVEEEGDRPPLPVRKSTSTSLNDNNSKSERTSINPILTQLKDAFPNIEEKYIITVMIASQGELDPAFNALLYLSDPEANKEMESFKQKKRGEKNNSQLHQDELLARQLDEEFNYRHHQSQQGNKRTNPVQKIPRRKMTPEDIELARERREDHERRRRKHMTLEEKREIYGDEDEDSWSHFVEKDIPEVATAASTTLQETASRVSNWFNGVKTNWNQQQQQQQQQGQEIRGPNRNTNNGNGYEYDQDQIKQQEEAFRYYERQKKQQQQQQEEEKDLPSLPERRRFNSFGARVGEQEPNEDEEDTLQNHGISLKDDELSDDEDVPPQLPRREKMKKDTNEEDDDLYNEEANLSTITNENKVIPQSTYIDTPETNNEKKKGRFDNNDSVSTPTKSNPNQKSVNIEDDFLINTDDEL
ncbi:ubiquitin-binding protein Cue5p [Monosporozyma unispora]